MQDLEQAIRERAYHLWVERGRAEGDADAHWLAAQREILRASLSTFARVTTTEQPTAMKIKKSKSSTRAA
jgi:Protein of unknown function (DUF2934)